MNALKTLGVAGLLACVTSGVAQDQPKWEPAKVDEKLPKYERKDDVEGKIVVYSVDTMENIGHYWTGDLRELYPQVDFQFKCLSGSSPKTALLRGTCDIAAMARKLNEKELSEFKEKYEFEPGFVAVAVDALSIFVHKDNPIKGLSLQQVDAIFSTTRKRAYESDITKWGQVGATGEWRELRMVFHGRDNGSGTYLLFKELALSKGDYKDAVNEHPRSATVVAKVAEERGAIGYSGIGYKTDGVRMLPLSESGEEYIEPTAENCYSGKYPLSRSLYLYFNRAPGKDLKPVVREYLRYTHSKEGQECVVKDGYIPLTRAVVDKYADAYK